MKTKMNVAKSSKPEVKAKPAIKAKAAPRYTTEIGEYNGRPTIKITDNEARNPMYGSFTFGLGKAKMILATIEDIEAFVSDNEE